MVEIVVKGRRTEVPDRFRRHVEEKLAKIEKLDAKVLRVDVEVTRERNPRLADQAERIQITCMGRGPVIRAEAGAGDPYTALDAAWARLETRLRKAADRRQDRWHGRGVGSLDRLPEVPPGVVAARPADTRPDGKPVRANGKPARANGKPGRANGSPDEPDVAAEIPPAEPDLTHVDDPFEGLVEDRGPMVVREKVHLSRPMSMDDALYEMEMVGHDFFLYQDADVGLPSVVYRRHGYDYGVIRLRS